MDEIISQNCVGVDEIFKSGVGVVDGECHGEDKQTIFLIIHI